MKLSLLSCIKALLFISLTVFHTGCNTDDPATLSVSEETIQVGSNAQVVPLTITSNTSWTAESDAPWVRLSRAAGRGSIDIDLLIESCTAVNDRSATITIKAEDKSSLIYITQSATAGLLIIAPDSMTVDNTGGQVSFVIASNSPWTIASSDQWAVPSVTSGNGNTTVTVTVASNESHFEPRRAALAITTGQGTNAIAREFIVNQLSRTLPHITIAQQAVTFACNAKTVQTGEVLIPIVSNITGSLIAHTEFNWCTPSIVTIQGVKYIRIVCESDNTDNNNRDCIIRIQAQVEGETTMAQVRVTQAGLGSPEVILFRNTIALDCNPATTIPVSYFFPNGKNITIQAVSEESRWITQVKVDAVKKQITFNVEKNPSTEARVGTIMVTATLGSETLQYPITVTQDGVGKVEVEVLPASLNLGAVFNLSATATVTSQTAYSTISAVASDAGWLTVTMDKETANGGSYAQAITLTTTPNTQSVSRTATVTLTVSYGDKLVLRTISVTQAGIGSPYLVLMPQEVVVSKESHHGEANNIKITYLAPANVTVSVISTATWMNATVATSQTIAINIPESNEDEADRVGIVNVSVSRDGETVVYPVKVTQRGLGAIDVRIAPAMITLDPAAKTGVQFVVSAQYSGADVTADVTNGSEWIRNKTVTSAITSANAATKIVAFDVTPNPDAEPRTGTLTVTTVWGNKADVRTVTVVQNGLGAPAVSTVANIYLLSDQTTHTQSLWIEDGNKNNVTYQVTGISYQPGTNNVKQTAWMTNARVSNHNLVITSQPNTFDEAREGEITLIATRGTSKTALTVHVTQAGHKTAGISNLPALITHDFNAVINQALPFAMLNNSTVKAVYTSHPTWLSVTKTSNSNIVYSLKPFDGGEPRDYREGTITIVVENGHANVAIYTIAVRQLAPEMAGILHLQELITRSYEKGSGSITFALQNGATLGTPTITYSGTTSNWLTLQAATTADKITTLPYSVEAYPGGEEGGYREAVITLPVTNAHANGVSYTIRVRQYAPEMPALHFLPEKFIHTYVEETGIAIPYSLQNATQNGRLAGIVEVASSVGASGWLKAGFNEETKTLWYSVSAFAGGVEGKFREAYIHITVKNSHANAATYVIAVRQYAPEMPGILHLPPLVARDFNPVIDGILSLALQNGSKVTKVSVPAAASSWLAVGVNSMNESQLAYTMTSYNGAAGDYRMANVVITVENNHANKVEYTLPFYQYAPNKPRLLELLALLSHPYPAIPVANAQTVTGMKLLNNAHVVDVFTSDDWLQASHSGDVVNYWIPQLFNGSTGTTRQAYIYITVANEHINSITYAIPVMQFEPPRPGLRDFVSATYTYEYYDTGTYSLPLFPVNDSKLIIVSPLADDKIVNAQLDGNTLKYNFRGINTSISTQTVTIRIEAWTDYYLAAVYELTVKQRGKPYVATVTTQDIAAFRSQSPGQDKSVSLSRDVTISNYPINAQFVVVKKPNNFSGLHYEGKCGEKLTITPTINEVITGSQINLKILYEDRRYRLLGGRTCNYYKFTYDTMNYILDIYVDGNKIGDLEFSVYMPLEDGVDPDEEVEEPEPEPEPEPKQE